MGDLVQVYIKLQNEKRGKWSDPKPISSYDMKSEIVTVPEKNGRKINGAVEDICFAISDNELAEKYQEATDSLEIALDQSIDSLPEPIEVCLSSESSSDDEIGPKNPRKLIIGDKIEVFWPLMDTSYSETVSKLDTNTGIHGIK